MIFTFICVSCQEEVIEQTLTVNNLNAKSYDLGCIFENADSISYGVYAVADNPNISDSIIEKMIRLHGI